MAGPIRVANRIDPPISASDRPRTSARTLRVTNVCRLRRRPTEPAPCTNRRTVSPMTAVLIPSAAVAPPMSTRDRSITRFSPTLASKAPIGRPPSIAPTPVAASTTDTSVKLRPESLRYTGRTGTSIATPRPPVIHGKYTGMTRPRSVSRSGDRPVSGVDMFDRPYWRCSL